MEPYQKFFPLQIPQPYHLMHLEVLQSSCQKWTGLGSPKPTLHLLPPSSSFPKPQKLKNSLDWLHVNVSKKSVNSLRQTFAGWLIAQTGLLNLTAIKCRSKLCILHQLLLHNLYWAILRITRTSVHLNKLIKGNAQHQFKLSKKLNIATTFNVIVNFLLYQKVQYFCSGFKIEQHLYYSLKICTSL